MGHSAKVGRPKKDGFTIDTDKRSGAKYVRFTHEGERYHESLGTKDDGQAREAAALIFSDVIAGRYRRGMRRAVTVEFRPGQPLAELAAQWCEFMRTTHDAETVDTYEGYARRWNHHFKTLSSITSFTGERYFAGRLLRVLRKTAGKERSAMKSFFDWLRMEGVLTAEQVPKIPLPPSHMKGVRAEKYCRKGSPVSMSADEVEAILKHLPVWAPRRERGTKKQVPVRGYYCALWDQGFRASGAQAFADGDFQRGTLHVRAEADKMRLERDIPLTDRVSDFMEQAIAERGPGLIFGANRRHDLLKKAALQAGLDADRAKRITDKDFRKAFLTDGYFETGEPVGMMFLAGHRNPSTARHYILPTNAAGKSALVALQAKRAKGSRHFGRVSAGTAGESASEPDATNADSPSVVRGGELESPHLSVPEPKSGASASSAILAASADRSTGVPVGAMRG